MFVRMRLRANCAKATFVVCGLVVTAGLMGAAPAAEGKAAPHSHRGKRAAAKVGFARGAKKRAALPNLSERTGLDAGAQLAAMDTAVAAAPAFYAGRATGCGIVTALLASQPGQIMAGNFRDSDGNCYVWLNLQQSALLTGPEICKTTLHEMGHLSGLQHSSDPDDVMYAPFQADPIPAPCAVEHAAR